MLFSGVLQIKDTHSQNYKIKIMFKPQHLYMAI